MSELVSMKRKARYINIKSMSLDYNVWHCYHKLGSGKKLNKTARLKKLQEKPGMESEIQGY